MARAKDPLLRGRLLQAAAAEFAERGFHGTSVDGIAARAGVTKGGLYFHFRSKEELFFAALDDWRNDLRAAVRAASEADGRTGADGLRALLSGYLEQHFANRAAAGLLRMLSVQLQGSFTAEVREDLRSVFRGVRARIRELLVEGQSDGSLFANDPAAAAFLLAAALEGVVQQWLASERDVETFCDPRLVAESLVAPYTTDAGVGPPLPRPDPQDQAFPPF